MEELVFKCSNELADIMIKKGATFGIEKILRIMDDISEYKEDEENKEE